MVREAKPERRSVAPLIALSPALIVTITFLLLPLVVMLRYSFNRYDPQRLMVEAFTGENYVRLFTEPYFLDALSTTVRMAVVCTVTALVLGFPVAYVLARSQSRLKSLLTIAILFPLLVGNVVRAAGWMAVLGRQGFVNVSLISLGIIDTPLELMYTPWAVYVGLVGVTLPFMILSLQGVLEGLDYTLLDAANNLGASPATAFRRVVVPLALPGIVAGSILVFTVCMNAYATPFLLGGPSFNMMAPTIYRQIAVASNWPFGAALAFILITVTLAATIAANYVTAKYYRGR